jgi:CRP-like cAMP-binding protein/FixJ family two-component response regulator
MKKILIIDNNPEIRENISEILKLAYYKTITAANGKTGINLALEEKPHLIICNINMPEMNGYEVLHLLSRNPVTTTIPFIFLTAKKAMEDLRKGMSMGADDYLFKPVEEMELLTAVETRLKKNERFHKKFTGSIEGLDEFMASLNGVKELNRLTFERKIHIVNKKEIVFNEGEEANSIIFINKGIVKTFIMNGEGKEMIKGLNREGEFIGPLDLLESKVYRESAMAIEDSEIVKIPKHNFFSLLTSNHDVSVRFIHALSNNLNELHERLLHQAYDSVRKRTARGLLSLPKKSETGSSSKKISISREDLASFIGITPESVSRTLHAFKAEGLIDFTRSEMNKEITILKEDKLRQMKN